jgi:excisionase family DNA binding protein
LTGAGLTFIQITVAIVRLRMLARIGGLTVLDSNPLPAPGKLAYSISEFCALVDISRSYFYKMSDDERPREVRKGKRRLIPADAVKAWLAPQVAA